MVTASRDSDVVQYQEHPSKRDMNRGWIRSAPIVNEFLLAGFLILAFTGAAWLVEPFTGYQTVALLYLLLVVLIGAEVKPRAGSNGSRNQRHFVELSFCPADFTFYVQKFHDGIMFIVFFVVALAMGHLTSRSAGAK